MARPKDRDVSRYLQHLIREWLKEHPDSTASDLADAIHTSKTTISVAQSKAEGGPDTLFKMGKVLNKSPGDLLNAAKEWALANPEGSALLRDGSVPPVDEIPERARAATRARADLERAIADIQERTLSVGTGQPGPSEHAWYDMIIGQMRQASFGLTAATLPMSTAETAPANYSKKSKKKPRK